MDNLSLNTQTVRDLDLLTKIEADPDISQANLADELGVAVGTINWYLKRLISKGYVKVKRAQRKKLRYIITPEGIALRTRLTVEYIQNSFELYRRTREATSELLQEIRHNGYNRVWIDGNGDIAEVCRLTCLEHNMPVSSDENAPKIQIDGINLALHLPADDVASTDPAQEEHRGDHGKTD